MQPTFLQKKARRFIPRDAAGVHFRNSQSGSFLQRSMLQETATTLIGMLLGMAFTHAFNGEL